MVPFLTSQIYFIFAGGELGFLAFVWKAKKKISAILLILSKRKSIL